METTLSRLAESYKQFDNGLQTKPNNLLVFTICYLIFHDEYIR